MQPFPGRKAGQPYTAVVRHNTPSCKSNSSTTISSLQAEPHDPPTQPLRHGTSCCVCSDNLHHISPCTIYHQSLSATFLLPGLGRRSQNLARSPDLFALPYPTPTQGYPQQNHTKELASPETEQRPFPGSRREHMLGRVVAALEQNLAVTSHVAA